MWIVLLICKVYRAIFLLICWNPRHKSPSGFGNNWYSDTWWSTGIVLAEAERGPSHTEQHSEVVKPLTSSSGLWVGQGASFLFLFHGSILARPTQLLLHSDCFVSTNILTVFCILSGISNPQRNLRTIAPTFLLTRMNVTIRHFQNRVCNLAYVYYVISTSVEECLLLQLA